MSPSTTTGSEVPLNQPRLRVQRAGLVELMRLRDARQEVTQPVVIGIQPATDDVEQRARGHECPGWDSNPHARKGRGF